MSFIKFIGDLVNVFRKPTKRKSKKATGAPYDSGARYDTGKVYDDHYTLNCDVAAQVGADAIKLEALEEDFGQEVKAAVEISRVKRAVRKSTRKPARKKATSKRVASKTRKTSIKKKTRKTGVRK